MTRAQLEKLTDAELRRALETVRLNRGYKQREIAALLGVTTGGYNHAKSSTRPLMPHNREKLIAFLEGENLTPAEPNDVRAIRVIDSAIALLTEQEKRRVGEFVSKKLKESRCKR